MKSVFKFAPNTVDHDTRFPGEIDIFKSQKTVNCFVTLTSLQIKESCETSSSHGGEYDVQSCLLGYTAV
jgi:hypothetical protein